MHCVLSTSNGDKRGTEVQIGSDRAQKGLEEAVFFSRLVLGAKGSIDCCADVRRKGVLRVQSLNRLSAPAQREGRPDKIQSLIKEDGRGFRLKLGLREGGGRVRIESSRTLKGTQRKSGRILL